MPCNCQCILTCVRFFGVCRGLIPSMETSLYRKLHECTRQIENHGSGSDSPRFSWACGGCRIFTIQRQEDAEYWKEWMDVRNLLQQLGRVDNAKQSKLTIALTLRELNHSD